MRSSELDYDLPPGLIAQRPLHRRDASRLLVYRRATGEVGHPVFADLPDILTGQLAVLYDTRVVQARLRVRRESGGEAEVLLLERLGANGTWEALARPLEVGCRCPAYERFSRAYIRHLVNQDELLGLRLLSLHNLWFVLRLTAGARDAITRGELAAYKADVLARLAGGTEEED